MPVRDFRALEQGPFELVDFDVAFDLSRAVKSAEELALVRESMAINEAGFWAVHEAYEPGRTQAELMAAAEEIFTRMGTGRQTMDMVVWGHAGSATPEFRIPDPQTPIAPDDLLLYSLEVAGPGGHWVEFSRPLTRGAVGADTQRMLEAYAEYAAAARATMRAGASAHDVHRAVSAPFHDRGYPLGHVTGHSIGMTMIEHPKIGEGVDVELREGMIFSMHPHAIADGGSAACTCRTPGASAPTAASRCRAFRWRSSTGTSLARHPTTSAKGARAMLLAATEYVRPDSLEDALAALARTAGSRVLAGGQTLINVLKHRAASVELLVDISRLEELRFIEVRGRRIGHDRRRDDLPRARAFGRAARDAQPVDRRGRGGHRRPPGARARHDRRQRVLRRPGVQLPAAARRARRDDGDRRSRRARSVPGGGVLPRPVPHRGRSGELLRSISLPPLDGAGVGYRSLQIAADSWALARAVAWVRRRGDDHGGARRAGLRRRDTGARRRDRGAPGRRTAQRGGGERRRSARRRRTRAALRRARERLVTDAKWQR